jgi:hypothetical protein
MKPLHAFPWLSPVLIIATGQQLSAEGGTFEYQFESYDERDGRVDVESHYFDIRQQFESGASLGVRYVIDRISGATPVGTYDRNDPTQWDFVEISDEREAVSLIVDQKIGDHLLAFEYSGSQEADYRSNAVALSGKSELFDKNTVISAGVSYADDTIIATPGTVILEDRSKDSVDFALGVSQLLTKNSVLDVNFTYGHSEGYLADPYRQISQTRTIFVPVAGGGTIPVTDTFAYPENRPDSRDKFALKMTGRQYFETVEGSLIGSYRVFSDLDGIFSNTLDLTWKQQVSERFIVSPFIRFYDQTAADFYRASLTGSGVNGHGRNDGEPAYYSSDYRLAGFQSLNYGLGFDYQLNEDVVLNFNWERYEMSGTSSETPDILFPTADVFSFGIKIQY